jgi:hypothetical protein
MKRILGAIAAGMALLFTMAATPADTGSTDASCLTTEDLVLNVQEIDAATLSSSNGEISGTIRNNSSEYGYDDVIVRIDYYDAQDVLIDAESIKIHRDIDPGESESFTRELNAPADAAHARLSVDCAEGDRATTDELKFWEHNW